MQLAPALRAVDSVEHVRARALLPRQLTALAQPLIRSIAYPPLWVRRRRIQVTHALDDVTVMPADDDLPPTLGRDLRADAFAFDPLLPQVVRLAVRADAVGDHMGVVVVRILMSR